MILQVILEGIGLGILLILVCAIGIRKGAVGMVHLYDTEVQDRCIKLGLTTHKKIERSALIFKAVCVPGYIAYVLVCVYAVNGAQGFLAGFWQLLVILSVMNLIDRFLIDGYWVGHTNAWTRKRNPTFSLDLSVRGRNIRGRDICERCWTLPLPRATGWACR